MNGAILNRTIFNLAAQAIGTAHKVVNFRSVKFSRLTDDGLHKITILVESTAPKAEPKAKKSRSSK